VQSSSFFWKVYTAAPTIAPNSCAGGGGVLYLVRRDGIKANKAVGMGRTLSCAVMVSSWLVGEMMVTPVAEGAPERAKELCVVSQE
jgi:hypothetical protein